MKSWSASGFSETDARLLCDHPLAMDMGLSQQNCAALIAFLALMHKWNRVYNLTAVRDPQQMIGRHLLDSLSVAPFIAGQRVLDVGTGPGLPGIPLAVAQADKSFVLLDSRQKKTRFVAQAIIELGLPNVEVVTSRIEDYEPGKTFDTVVSRAFTRVTEFVSLTRRLCGPGGRLVLMKGVFPHKELGTLQDEYAKIEVHPVNVPGLDVQRHIVVIQV
jgi:16S rRNA (guanine527-N7)-methyltransferase